MTPPGASAGRKGPKTFLTVDPRGRPYAKRQFKRQAWPPTRVGVNGTVLVIFPSKSLLFVGYLMDFSEVGVKVGVNKR